MDRRREVVVQQERSDARGRERRNEPAEQRGGHGQRQEQKHVVGEPHIGSYAVQQQGQQGGPRDAHQPSPQEPPSAESRPAGDGQTTALSCLSVGDDVDVEVGT